MSPPLPTGQRLLNREEVPMNIGSVKDLPPGHGWAYAGVLLGLSASLAGNVANTVLTPSGVPVLLRVAFALLWPIFLGIGIEVLTRIEWERGWRHWAARAVLVGPVSLVAGFVSYLHLHHLMVLSGEPGLAQAFGPLAVDGTLLGCTVALLLTRVRSRQVIAADPGPVQVPAVTQVPIEVPEVPAVDPVPALVGPEVPVSPAPVRTRVPASRGSVSWDVDLAVKLMAEGTRTDTEIGSEVGTGYKMIQRSRRALNLLREDPGAEVPKEWKVPAVAVERIRELVRVP
jgi:hypothetical protein